jgi:MSHA pilin protein MshD
MSINLRCRARSLQRGVTMIELILFIVIVGVALTVILGVMNLTTQRSADPVRRKQALLLAEALLEEVEQARFTYCDVFDPRAADEDPPVTGPSDCAAATVEKWGAEANNQRPFDNVNDYVVDAANAATPFTDKAGNLLDTNGNILPLSGFTASVRIRPAALASGSDTIGKADDTSAQTDVLRITVTIGYDGQTLSLDGFRTRYAPASL